MAYAFMNPAERSPWCRAIGLRWVAIWPTRGFTRPELVDARAALASANIEAEVPGAIDEVPAANREPSAGPSGRESRTCCDTATQAGA